MTCKDCIHYVVCWRVKEVETGNPMISSYHICRAFKDKSRFIELLCNVGAEKALKEMERLKIENQSLRSAASSYKLHYNKARTEAVKEFAKRLKENISNAIDTYYNSNGGGYYLAEDTMEDIDNLVKEMIGDTE